MNPPVLPEDQGLYVHFPYCVHKCSYCDFNSHAVEHSDQAYADAIIRELDQKRPIFEKTAYRGHFGRDEFPWEATNKVAALQEAVAAKAN